MCVCSVKTAEFETVSEDAGQWPVRDFTLQYSYVFETENGKKRDWDRRSEKRSGEQR